MDKSLAKTPAPPVTYVPPWKLRREPVFESEAVGGRALHSHPHWEIGCVLHGECRLELAKGRHLVEPGDVFVLAPGAAHQEQWLPGKSPATISYVSLEAEALPACPAPCTKFPFSPGRDFRPVFRSIANELSHRAAGWERLIELEIRKIFLLLERAAFTPRGEEDPVAKAFRRDLVAQWKAFVEANAHRREFRMAPHGTVGPVTLRRFQTLFRLETGTTCKAWVDEVRLERARHLLEFSKEPVRLIAERCGFADVFHFTRRFGAYAGISPARFRLGASEKALKSGGRTPRKARKTTASN